MSRAWVLLLFHFWAVNPSRCILCLYASFFFYFILLLSPFPHSEFLFHCVPHSLSLTLTPFLSLPVDEDVFLALRVLGRCLLVASSVFDFVCVLVSCVFIFIILCTFFVPSWRQCPLLDTFLSVCILLSAFPAFFLQTCPTIFWLDEEIIVSF